MRFGATMKRRGASHNFPETPDHIDLAEVSQKVSTKKLPECRHKGLDLHQVSLLASFHTFLLLSFHFDSLSLSLSLSIVAGALLPFLACSTNTHTSKNGQTVDFRRTVVSKSTATR